MEEEGGGGGWRGVSSRHREKESVGGWKMWAKEKSKQRDQKRAKEKTQGRVRQQGYRARTQ